jgi:hypothetical protein
MDSRGGRRQRVSGWGCIDKTLRKNISPKINVKYGFYI